jgi:hypothetical protein
MDIKPRDQTIKNLLESGFYRIPRFQRAYSWDRENVADFWADAVVADDPAYFIGSFVLYTAKGLPDVYYVVDGQQRLTTITLLLAAVRDALDKHGFSDQAKGVQKLIERADLNNDQQFVLQSETPYPFFQEQIQKHGERDQPGQLGQEERALKAAYDFLTAQISGALSAVLGDTTLTETKILAALKEKLLQVRNKLLRLQLIAIQLDSEDNAYLIFETLNTRGKDLTVSDLVKNHLTRLLKPTNKGVDLAKDKWLKLLEMFDASEAGLNINRFLHHSWLSRKSYITEKLLYKEIKHSVTLTTAKNFLDTLLADARVYRHVLEPESRKWTKQERRLLESLRALNLFHVIQPVPMLLSLLRAYDDKDLTLNQTGDILRSMEDFHVQFTAITAQRTGGGTAFMYALSARELTAANSKDSRSQVLKSFRQKMQARIPSLEEFEAGLLDVRFSDENTKQRQLVRYLLRRLDEHFRQGDPPDYDQLTIEHLASQKPPGVAEAQPDVVAMFGNLLFVSEDLNGKLKNKPASNKLSIIAAAKCPMDPFLAKAKKWDESAIRERTQVLAKILHQDVLRV